jgi:hypothetical protein
VEFDFDGLHLATGDRGGRVVLFERVNPGLVRVSASIWHLQVTMCCRSASPRLQAACWCSEIRAN